MVAAKKHVPIVKKRMFNPIEKFPPYNEQSTTSATTVTA